jgi:CheY-like chemotaxis protein
VVLELHQPSMEMDGIEVLRRIPTLPINRDHGVAARMSAANTISSRRSSAPTRRRRKQ